MARRQPTLDQIDAYLLRNAKSSFWGNKRVAITGHTGFKGGWLSIWLNTLGAKVFGLSLPPITPFSLYEEANIAAFTKETIGDIQNYKTVQRFLDAAEPEIIFHMAAQPLVSIGYLQPLQTLQTNIMGTAHLLEATRFSDSVKVFVNVTSDKCYENAGSDKEFTEDDRLGGEDPYSCSKGCSELITHAYRESFYKEKNISLASVRAGNVIGGGDWSANRLVPDILQAMEIKQPALIKNPESIRPWQHVLDPLSGYLLLAERLYQDKSFANCWNFGPNEDAKSVGWIADQLTEHWGQDAHWQLTENAHFSEAKTLALDSSKAQSKLGWSPTWSSSEAIQKTAEWHKKWIEKSCAKQLCEEQIEFFVASSNCKLETRINQ